MFRIRLKPHVERKLETLAKQTGRSKNHHAQKAISRYLEDREDYRKGAVLKRREPTISLEELERRFGTTK